jgi:hypothetical protein
MQLPNQIDVTRNVTNRRTKAEENWFMVLGPMVKMSQETEACCLCVDRDHSFLHLSKSITISQCEVWGNRSTAIALLGMKGSELGMDFVRCLARPAALIDRHPRLPLFFSCFSDVGVHSSIALATRLSGLQEMYLRLEKWKPVDFRPSRIFNQDGTMLHTYTRRRMSGWVLNALITYNHAPGVSMTNI